MLSLETLELEYEPFPIGLARAVIAPDVYAEMVRTFPDVADFRFRESKGNKFALSQQHHRMAYYRHIRQHAVWREFYDYIKSRQFIDSTLAKLQDRSIDLGVARKSVGERMKARFRSLKKGAPMPHFPHLSARFEFSAMPVMGGSIRPHTDNPNKTVVLVLAILEEGEWNPEYGGGTAIVRPKDRTKIYNVMNHYLDFGEVDVMQTFPFQPNQCVVFVQTFNSWHAVCPMTGDDPGKLRRTLTINIENS